MFNVSKCFPKADDPDFRRFLSVLKVRCTNNQDRGLRHYLDSIRRVDAKEWDRIYVQRAFKTGLKDWPVLSPSFRFDDDTYFWDDSAPSSTYTKSDGEYLAWNELYEKMRRVSDDSLVLYRMRYMGCFDEQPGIGTTFSGTHAYRRGRGVLGCYGFSV